MKITKIVICLLFIFSITCFANNVQYDSFDGLYGQSLENISEHFLGKKYYDASSNDKKKIFDEPPIIIDDNFDCLTFVEMVLGINISNSFGDLKDNLIKIKYKNNTVNFFNRNHFISPDWIKNNDDILRNITLKFQPQYFRNKTVFFEKKRWFLKNHKNFYDYLKSLDMLQDYRKFSNKRYMVNYLDYNIAFTNRFIISMPDEAIVFLVKDFSAQKDKIGTDLDVFHCGFLFKHGHEIIFRHASYIDGKVEDVNFMDYITSISNNSPNFQGFIILKQKDK